MKTNVLRSAVALLCAAAPGLVTGCGSDWQNYNETFVRAGITAPDCEAPGWVLGPLPADPERVFFVGRAVAYNVFDERAACQEARRDALLQVGQYIGTWVSARSSECDRRSFRGGEKPLSVVLPFARCPRGPEFLPGEKAKQCMASCTALVTEALAGDLVEHDVYWEQWSLQESPCDLTPCSNTASRTMKRYKVWVLVSVDRRLLESRIDSTFEALRLGACGGGKFYSTTSSFGTAREVPRADPQGARVLRGL